VWRYGCAVHSRAILAMAYDRERNELSVTFTGGRAYLYSLIPPAIVAALEAAASPGAFFNRHIRDRYPYRRVRADAGETLSLKAALRRSASS
jgi:lysyl-tRNA synthetase class 2